MEKNKNLPLCYSFSFDIDTMTLFFKIQKCIISEIKKDLQGENSPVLENKEKIIDKIPFLEFGEKGKDFGLNKAIIWSGENENEIIYSCHLVPAIESTENVCGHCDGKKIDSFHNPCYDCRETGREHVYSGRFLDEILSSLYPIIVLANKLLLDISLGKESVIIDFPQGQKQYFAVQWADRASCYTGGIEAWVDDIVSDWVNTISDSISNKIVESMRKTDYLLLLREKDCGTFGFSSDRNGGFGFDVPGSACGLDVTPWNPGLFPFGVSLGPHNVDKRVQQLELLVGIATLGDLFNKHKT